MSIISRYIAMTWLRLLALCQLSFVSVYLVLDMMEKVPRFIRAGGAALDILLFFVFKLPEMVGQTAAFSCLMATLLTLGLLSRNSEIIAMRSCGVSLLKIAAPMLVLGGGVSLLLLVNSELIVPRSFERMNIIERVAIKKQGETAVFKRNNIWFRSDDLIVQARMFDPKAKQLMGVVVWTVDSTMRPVRRMDAESADFQEGTWHVKTVTMKDFTGFAGFSEKNVPELEVPLNLKIDDLKVLDNNADNLSFRKLQEYAGSLSRSGSRAYRYTTMMHSKLSAPFSAFVMVLLGIPFAFRSNNRSGGVAIGIVASVAIGFAYFVVNALLLSYGRSGVLPPLLAAWGANLLFIAGGSWLTVKTRG